MGAAGAGACGDILEGILLMAAQKEKVSVILPTFNRAYVLERAIRSVLAQSYENLELIVADDGSTDGTSSLVAAVKDERVRYVRTEKNRGAAGARNYGLQCATGVFVAFQDSDDYWRPEKLRLQVEELEKEQAGFCYHKVQYDFGEGQIAVLPQEHSPLEQKCGDIYAQLLHENMVDCPALLVRRECLEEVGAFDEGLRALEDYDLALRLGNAFYAAFVNQVLVDKSYTEGSVSLQAEHYLDASCRILFRYWKDYLATGNFDHRVGRILEDAQKAGRHAHYLELLMKRVDEEQKTGSGGGAGILRDEEREKEGG